MSRLFEMLADDTPLARDRRCAAGVRAPVLLTAVNSVLVLREIRRVGTAEIAKLALKPLFFQMSALDVTLELSCRGGGVSTTFVMACMRALASVSVVVVFQSLCGVETLVAILALEPLVCVPLGLPRRA